MDHARLERLGELVRTLLPLAPELDVYTEAPQLADVAPGATVVLVPRVEDADWLNRNRPLFASRQLRVVLFCSREVSVALSRGAVDFVDWMSLRVDCPPGPAPFAVAGLRSALAARVPGIVWTGGDLEASFAAARPRGRLRRVSAARPYEELVAEAKADRREWIVWTDVDGAFRLRKVRWALAEAGRRTRTILLEPQASSPGWTPVHGRLAELSEAREQLRRAGVPHPGRWAALTELEPEALRLLDPLLSPGVDPTPVSAALGSAPDPGSALGRLALDQGLLDLTAVAHGRAQPPVLRAAQSSGQSSRVLRTEALEATARRLAQGERVDAEEALWWSAWSRVAPRTPPGTPDIRNAMPEVRLRQGVELGQDWEDLSWLALDLNQVEVAHGWALRAARLNPSSWRGLAQSFLHQERFTEADALLQRQLATPERLSPANYRWALFTLGSVRTQQDRVSEARDLMLRALELTRKSEGRDSEMSVLALRELAILALDSGDHADAERLLREALVTAEALPVPNAILQGFIQQFLGTLLLTQGRRAEAEQVLTHSRQSLQQQTETSPPYNSASLLLATALNAQGRYAEAERAIHQTLDDLKRVAPPHHSSQGRARYHLAAILTNQGRYAEAGDSIREALDILGESLGQEHKQYAACLHLLGIIQDAQGLYAQATRTYRQSLALLAKSVGRQHPEYAHQLGSLGSVLQAQGHYDEAHGLFQEAADRIRQTLGSLHPAYTRLLNQFASNLIKQARYAESERVLREALALEEQSLGIHHPGSCSTLANLGFTLMLDQRPLEGEPFVQRAIDLAMKTWGPSHPWTGKTLTILARVQARLGRPEAKATARQALTVLQEALGPEHPEVHEESPELLRIIEGKN